jgi:mevalonate kinase
VDQTPLRRRSLSLPGKAFLLGEYAAIDGRLCIVAAVSPRFELRAQAGAKLEGFHPLSPVARLLASAPLEGYVFHDPLEGRGGFGASTAQFALCARAMDPRASTEAIWRKYRELEKDQALPPSGADLVAQLEGGITAFSFRKEFRARALKKSETWGDVLLFSATDQPGRKLPTHTHLQELAGRGFPREYDGFLDYLEPYVVEGAQALERGDSVRLGECMKLFATMLSKKGLESEAARADRLALASLPGVHGVKGTGALLHDGVVAVVERAHQLAVIAAAEARGLRLVRQGLDFEPGLREG